MAQKKTTPKKTTSKPKAKKPAAKKKKVAPAKEHVHDEFCGHDGAFAAVEAIAPMSVPAPAESLIPKKKKSLWRRIVGFGL